MPAIAHSGVPAIAAIRARPGNPARSAAIERQQVGNCEDETHHRCLTATRGTSRGAPSLACDNSPHRVAGSAMPKQVVVRNLEDPAQRDAHVAAIRTAVDRDA